MRSPSAVKPSGFIAILLTSFSVLLLGFGCSALLPEHCSDRPLIADPPPPPTPTTEFRAVFVTTAYNLDWPSKPGLHYRVMDDEIRAVVNRAKELNCNVIILQIRAFGDRIHRGSNIPDRVPASEPWSTALNPGKDRDPDKKNRNYNPLCRWIQVCHESGIELHVWVNPFRVNDLVYVKVGGTTYPLPVKIYAKHLYLDPTSNKVQDYVVEVIDELLAFKAPCKAPKLKAGEPSSDRLYASGGEIDGILFDHDLSDSYRWGATQPASKDKTSREGPSSTKPGSRIDWLYNQAKGKRIPNTTTKTLEDFIRAVSSRIRNNPGGQFVKFGLSPSSNDPDAQGWLSRGLIDYVIPEFYSPDDFTSQLQTWMSFVPKGPVPPIVVAGLFTTRVQSPDPDTDTPWSSQVIQDQVISARAAQTGAKKPWAQAHYSWSALRAAGAGGPSDNIGEELKKDPYQQPALVPACINPPNATVPGSPTVTVVSAPVGDMYIASFRPMNPNDDVRFWAVWLHNPSNGWGPMQTIGTSKTVSFSKDTKTDYVAARGIDRYNQTGNLGYGHP